MHNQDNINSSQYYDDEITLKELILKIVEFSKELWRRKFLIIIIAIICGGIAYALNLKFKNTYSSSLSFLLNENTESNTDAAISALLGINSSIPLNKVTEIAKSARVLHNVILSKGVVNGKVDYFGNHIINIYDLHKDWDTGIKDEKYKELDLTNFYFEKNKVEDFKTNELRALSQIHKLIVSNILTISYNDKTSIFNMNVTTQNSELTSELLNTIYTQLIKFYTYQTVGKPKENFSILVQREDSLYSVMTKMESQLAYLDDRTLGLKSRAPLVGRDDLKRKYNSALEMYNKVNRNKEELEFMLQNKSPEFQILDRTFIPKSNTSSWKKNVLIGLFIGLFLGVIYVLGSKVIRDALAE
ncbi:Wzz/FepE/Etk N-terminal domain-containing protein [Saprospiraceae bacterium]|nr:Wzz/FepE/Etk N-terminal domain-containing protein [Saprospiraceae bacterium]